MKLIHGFMAMLLMAGGAAAIAQDAPPPPPDMHARHMADMHGEVPPEMWSKVADQLGLSQDQRTKLDTIRQQNRINLIDLHASLEKEEATLEPLMKADTPDEGKITSQIDRVAQARAELEKAHARMLLQIRTVLTADQWSKLQAMHGPGGTLHREMHHQMAPPPPAPPQ
jgi:Spy/CpxP family protein refolding chaperone